MRPFLIEDKKTCMEKVGTGLTNSFCMDGRDTVGIPDSATRFRTPAVYGCVTGCYYGNQLYSNCRPLFVAAVAGMLYYAAIGGGRSAAVQGCRC